MTRCTGVPIKVASFSMIYWGKKGNHRGVHSVAQKIASYWMSMMKVGDHGLWWTSDLSHLHLFLSLVSSCSSFSLQSVDTSSTRCISIQFPAQKTHFPLLSLIVLWKETYHPCQENTNPYTHALKVHLYPSHLDHYGAAATYIHEDGSVALLVSKNHHDLNLVFPVLEFSSWSSVWTSSLIFREFLTTLTVCCTISHGI